MSASFMNMLAGVSATVRGRPGNAAKTAGDWSAGGLPRACRPALAGVAWWGSLVALCAAASACIYVAPADDSADAGELAAPDYAPAVAEAPPAPPACPAEPPRYLAPQGVYCTPSVVWEFGEGMAYLYHSTTGQRQRGYVVRDDYQLAVAWMVACDGGELGDGVAVCEQVDVWPLVTTEDAITVGGVTAVAEWAGGCDQ